MRALLGLALVVCAATASAQSEATVEAGDAKKDEKQAPGFLERVVVRGGVHFDFGGAINLGGTSSSGRASAGLDAGVGYLLVPRFEVGIDANFTMRFVPSPVGVELFELTPGVRWRPIDQVQVRAGVPIPLVPTPGLGLLAGVAYVQPLGGKASLVVGVDYTWWLTDAWRQTAPQGRIDFRGGVQTSF